MLVLIRKNGESIVMGEITVQVLETKRGRVKIGIEAPISVQILRGELLENTAQRVSDEIGERLRGGN